MSLLAHIHNGQVIPDGPLPWPEGTRLQLKPVDEANGQVKAEPAPRGGPVEDSLGVLSEDRLDWENHIPAAPIRPAHQATVQFVPGGFRGPRIVNDDAEE